MSGLPEPPLHRRAFLAATTAPLVVSALATTGSIAKLLDHRIRAVVFDGFAIFNATKIVSDADIVVPGHARELVTTWRARQFEYQLTLTPVAALREAGLRLAFLSNMTESMLHSGAKRAGFRDAFELVLSTDRVKASKPDPRAYRMAVDAFGLERDRIAFVAFAGWDAAGATWFGYPTVWMNRMSAPPDALGNEPRSVARDLGEVVSLVRNL